MQRGGGMEEGGGLGKVVFEKYLFYYFFICK